jgi:hypothetical protein
MYILLNFYLGTGTESKNLLLLVSVKIAIRNICSVSTGLCIVFNKLLCCVGLCCVVLYCVFIPLRTDDNQK